MASRSRGAAEPSIPPLLIAAIRILGANRLMRPAVRRRLALSGLAWEQIEPVLENVRTIERWGRAFVIAADRAEKDGDLADASAFAYLGQLPLSPYNPTKQVLRAQFRHCHVGHRERRPGFQFEHLQLAGGRIVAYRETPLGELPRERPTILILPPLASTKEELTLLADPLLEAGYSVIRMDLPGQGESAPPLQADSERLIAEALDDLGLSLDSGVVAGGISLGAHYALRLAALEPDRIRGVFGVSPMAIRSEVQWRSLPEIIYQYLDIYFDSPARAETHRLARQMKLETEIADRIRCPVRLYHAANDSLAQTNAPEVYRSLIRRDILSEQIVEDRHGCLLHLAQFGVDLAEWCEGLSLRVANKQAEKR